MSSRQAVAGTVGLGKTTLAQHIKAEALRAGYWSTDGIVPLYAGDATDGLVVCILAAVYETLLPMLGPALERDEAGRDAKQLVRAFRVATRPRRARRCARRAAPSQQPRKSHG